MCDAGLEEEEDEAEKYDKDDGSDEKAGGAADCCTFSLYSDICSATRGERAVGSCSAERDE